MFDTASVRIGIDVGGTFTHAVAIDASTWGLLGKVKVLTTHRAQEGVALGIIESLNTLLKETNIDPCQVAFIAHSTTQATNALLEGDVARVGIIGMGAGANSMIAKAATKLGKIHLAPGKYLHTFHRFIDTTKPPSQADFTRIFGELKDRGAQAFAISEAFSPDQSDNEQKALAVAEQMGLLATAGFEITQLYGLKIRTRTAVLNASMLPKMLESAELTERCVRESGIKAPLMIMRSDGGVMDLASMRRKPILTMLSGPAAGVAAALMFLRISDGIFLEVGGTSTDISAIHRGRAEFRSAEVGGNKIFMRTLDVRTVGVAGGSLPRVNNSHIIDAGPRSAHIAGLGYVSFNPPLKSPTSQLIAPLANDPSDYAIICEGDTKLGLTTTCAANLLGFVPSSDCAYGNAASVRIGFEALATSLKRDSKELAQEFLDAAVKKCLPPVKSLLEQYQLDDQTTMLYGGGGGAAAIVPYFAKKFKMKHELAESADVLSAIGVAFALMRETVERQIINPTNEDILKIRESAYAALQKMGAEPSSIDVFVEIEAQTNTIRATACGAASMIKPVDLKDQPSEQDILKLVAESMSLSIGNVKKELETPYFILFVGNRAPQHPWWEFFKRHSNPLRAVDRSGVIRFQAKTGQSALTKCHHAEATIIELANKYSTWGDAGQTVPNIVLLAGPKIIDLSGLLNIEQILSLARVELGQLPADSQIIALVTEA